jgi:septal ring factor EnvC (AmiA/AmiB activator)
MKSARNFRRCLRVSLPTAVAVAVLCAPIPSSGQSGRSKEDAALAAVRKELQSLQSRLARQATQRDEDAQALRDIELSIAASAQELAAVRADFREQQARQSAVEQETVRAKELLDAERETLARAVRMSYMTGREEIFRLLLSQESPASLGRMLVYYDYYNRARTERIGAVSEKLRTLRRLDEEGAEVARNLVALEETQRTEVAALERARDERRILLAKLDTEIADANKNMKRLTSEEQRLEKLVKELGELMAGLPSGADEPFARLKGKLSWPVQGKIVADYGQPREGGPLVWNGVLLEASQGSTVRAVYRGRVAFADWLPGLGLLVIIDHGDGYMSLYGHNAALLKESGDWVEPGEEVAQVGDTGGQARPSLYFEVRANGQPVNPHEWIRQKPGAR